MSDHADEAQDYIELADALAVQTVRNRMQATGSDICTGCGDVIPAKRRRAVLWAETCITCQDILEHRARVGQLLGVC
ncbi:TraR/DksA C4-type zinc finger protein [Pantoea agglomerans]|uniref:TraR/DksA C4-type zinc finger protein n=1 Tax=Enterobacter agglomerans TaxID=549 RepID=UPI002413A53E|nr:TraR/DksA C4-type zinc finger protein [Pantoea agglomerans]